jgi:hypothetical protein
MTETRVSQSPTVGAGSVVLNVWHATAPSKQNKLIKRSLQRSLTGLTALTDIRVRAFRDTVARNNA